MHQIAQPVGVNTNYCQDYISALAFGDLAKRGQPWAAMNPQTGVPNGNDATVNSLGYPLEPAASRTLIQTYQVPLRQGTAVGDRVVLSYNEGTTGTGVLPTVVDLIGVNVFLTGSEFDAATGEQRKYYSLGYDENGLAQYTARVDIFASQLNSVDVVGNGGEDLDLKLHVWVDENHEAAQLADPTAVFHDQYLTRLHELNPSVIRTGPAWSRNTCSGSALGGWKPDWTKRRTLSSSRWSVGGEVPWEVHCYLANELGADLWVCIPLITFDPSLDETDPDYARAKTYVTELAKLIRDTLDPDRHCVVEWSNEMWNASFTTYPWLVHLVQDVDGNSPTIANLAAKAAEIMDLTFRWWLTEFNDCRVEFAVMGDATNTTWAQTIVDSLAPNNLVDDVGCTIYMRPLKSTEDGWLMGMDTPTNDSVGWDKVETAVQMSLDNDLDENDGGNPMGDGNTAFVRNHGAIALDAQSKRTDGHSVRLAMYESGPHLTVDVTLNTTYADTLRTVYSGIQNQPQMGNLVDRMLDRLLLPYDATTNPAGVQPALPLLPSRMAYYAFTQTKNFTFGSFYLLEDLYANLGPPIAVVHPDKQYKFESVRDFIANW